MSRRVSELWRVPGSHATHFAMARQSRYNPGMETALLAIVVLVVVIAVAILSERLPRKPFNPALWQSRPAERRQIVYDLIKGSVLMGMARCDVIALLGKPDYQSDSSLAYWLTLDRFGDKLRLRIGADGRVFKAKFEMGC